MLQKVIPDKTVERLLRMNYTLVEISQILERDFGIQVTPDALSIWRRRHGMARLRPASPVELIPRKIKSEHRFKQQIQLLRAEARVRRGEKLPDKLATVHANWKRWMEENDMVVAYDPEEGFSYAKRRPGIDTDLAQMPEKVTAQVVAAR